MVEKVKALLSLCVTFIILLTLHPVLCSSASQDIRPDIARYKDDASKIINEILTGGSKDQAYNRLANLTDKFGNRMLGSQALEDAIEYVIEELRTEFGKDNVRGEEAEYAKWVRGEETAKMMKPYNKTISIMGFGTSVGTGSIGITADVVVVDSFDDFNNQIQKNRDFARGKIVVFNAKFETYPKTVAYRYDSANMAASQGGVAALVRSIAPYSLYSPHTGLQSYNNSYSSTHIPVAAITLEDADMFSRMHRRGDQISLHLKMTSGPSPNKTLSKNIVAEIPGSTHPNEIVIIGGHIDSWDVGTGAMDDGGGVMVSWQALSVIKTLGLKPKRTVRAVFWTAEEEGVLGSTEYFNQHKNETNNISLIMESDFGTFKPNGLGFSGNADSRVIMQEVLNLMGGINTTYLGPSGSAPDIDIWIAAGVPGAELDNQNDKYFYYHHTEADTMTAQSPEHMDLCAAMWTVVTYVVADLDYMLPRGKDLGPVNSSPKIIIISPLLLTLSLFIFLQMRL